MSEDLTVTERREGAVLIVRLVPRASRDAVLGVQQGSLRVAVTAPPTDGRANEACCRLLAEMLDLPPSTVTILSGQTSRTKRILIRGLSAERVRAQIVPATSGAPPL